jgi:hypothetical protein
MSLESSKNKLDSSRSCFGFKDATKNDFYIKAIYDKLISVQYMNIDRESTSLNSAGKAYNFSLQRSFSILGWKVLNRLCESKQDNHNRVSIDPQTIDEETMTSICFNVLPNLQNILHLMGRAMVKTDTITSIFEILDKGIDKNKYFIPYFKDMNGKTPLELCLDLSSIN